MRVAVLFIAAMALAACNPETTGTDPVCPEGDQSCQPQPDPVLG
jgi:hypothetical protein